MTETDPLKQLAQLEGYNTIRSDHVRQMQLLRYWAEELATPRHADPKRLLRYGFKTYSQSDEDGIIQEIFKRIGTNNLIFVEFGVESGVECNSVKLLVEGWRGLWLEGSATRIEQIQKISKRFSMSASSGSVKPSSRPRISMLCSRGRRHRRDRFPQHRYRQQRLLGLEGDHGYPAARGRDRI